MATTHSSEPKTAGKRGRRPAGRSSSGEPEMVSRYPKLTISMKPETKLRLEAVATLLREPAWRIIDSALEAYMQSVPAEDRRAVDALVRRMEQKQL